MLTHFLCCVCLKEKISSWWLACMLWMKTHFLFPFITLQLVGCFICLWKSSCNHFDWLFCNSIHFAPHICFLYGMVLLSLYCWSWSLPLSYIKVHWPSVIFLSGFCCSRGNEMPGRCSYHAYVWSCWSLRRKGSIKWICFCQIVV